MDCGRGLNRSSTVAESGWHRRFIRGHSWAFGVNRGITDTPIHPDPPQFITKTVRGGGRGATGLNRSSTVSNRGRIVSFRSSTGVNRSAAVMSRSGTVDESCRHRRSIVRHRIDAGFSFSIPMHPDFTV